MISLDAELAGTDATMEQLDDEAREHQRNRAPPSRERTIAGRSEPSGPTSGFGVGTALMVSGRRQPNDGYFGSCSHHDDAQKKNRRFRLLRPH